MMKKSENSAAGEDFKLKAELILQDDNKESISIPVRIIFTENNEDTYPSLLIIADTQNYSGSREMSDSLDDYFEITEGLSKNLDIGSDEAKILKEEVNVDNVDSVSDNNDTTFISSEFVIPLISSQPLQFDSDPKNINHEINTKEIFVSDADNVHVKNMFSFKSEPLSQENNASFSLNNEDVNDVNINITRSVDTIPMGVNDILNGSSDETVKGISSGKNYIFTSVSAQKLSL